MGSEVEGTSLNAAHGFHRLQNIPEGDASGIPSNDETAIGPALAVEKSALDQLAQHLGKVGGRDLGCLGNQRVGLRYFCLIGEVGHSPKGIFNSL